MTTEGGDTRTGRVLRHFERAVILALVVMTGVLTAAATVELAVLILRDLLAPPLLDAGELLDLFAFLLLVLIGLELIETVRAYLRTSVVHVEIVLQVALIALARKVIVLDASEYPPAKLLGLAALILSVAAAYFLERHARERAA